MVLQGSGVITLSDIRGEFGGSAPDLLTEYYRGGGLVPDTAANSGIPTSGVILLSDFYGGDATVGNVQVSDPISVAINNSGVFVNEGVTFASNGQLQKFSDDSLINAGQWWSAEPATGIGANYDVRCQSVTSGSWSFAAAATGTWVNMATGQAWRVVRAAMASPGTTSCTGEFQIRDASTLTILDTFTVSASATN